jgi:hypothetical protein
LLDLVFFLKCLGSVPLFMGFLCVFKSNDEEVSFVEQGDICPTLK